MNTLKFHVFALAATFGIVWGAAVLLLGLAASLLGWGVPMVRLLGTVYLGYEPDLLGTLIGTAWAVVDGVICGAVFAWLYNWISTRCAKRETA